ncbi:hypothetical protein ABZV91_11940 [Nocardia sp. NPDC004568]|uniref:hypothetical protein n=1 Tax=Nocardia sp. NPDC004568 TaxID=3154551 RepID=UPI0033A57637
MSICFGKAMCRVVEILKSNVERVTDDIANRRYREEVARPALRGIDHEIGVDKQCRRDIEQADSGRKTWSTVLPDTSQQAGRGLFGPRLVATAHHDGVADGPIDTTIHRLESALGIHTDAERALEAKLFIDRKFLDIAFVSGQPRPETLFGKAEWAGHLEARRAAREHGRRPLTVEFMQDLHKRFQLHTDNPESGGVLTDGRGRGWGGLARPLAADEIAAIDGNPLLSYVPPPFKAGEFGLVMEPKHAGREGARWYRELDRPLTDSEKAAIDRDPLSWFVPGPIMQEHGVLLYPRFHDFRAELQSVADWYNDATSMPGYDSYSVAAELQRRVVTIHPWLMGDSGRWSRQLMNWSLERDGLKPAALAEFNKDLYSSLPDYTRCVREGSHRYGEWEIRVRSNPSADPVTAFGLEALRQRYIGIGGETAPFTPGEVYDANRYDQLLEQLDR